MFKRYWMVRACTEEQEFWSGFCCLVQVECLKESSVAQVQAEIKRVEAAVVGHGLLPPELCSSEAGMREGWELQCDLVVPTPAGDGLLLFDLGGVPIA